MFHFESVSALPEAYKCEEDIKDDEKFEYLRSADGNSYLCRFCDYSCARMGHLKSHIIYRHTKQFPFTCDVCNRGCITKFALDKHKQIKHQGKTYVCPHCSKIFVEKYNYDNHVRRHDLNYVPPIYKCKLCDKVLTTETGFKQHMYLHQGHKCVCDVCGKEFTSLQYLRKHKMTHTGQKNFFCETCGKGFYNRTTLVNHIRVHSKEKPYLCNVCSRAFSQKSNLDVHMRGHAESKPHKCETCARSFVKRYALKKHKCKPVGNK